MKLIQKSNIAVWLQRLNNDREVWVPSLNSNGDLMYTHLKEAGPICYDLKPMLSCRRILFPQEETLFEVKDKSGKQEFHQTIDTTKRVLFGIRSCDAKGIEFTDKFFSKNFSDIYYFSRRKNALIITLGCNAPMPNCWCNALGTGPFLDHGFDLQLYDINPKEFLIAIGSDAGKEAIAQSPSFFEEASDAPAITQIEKLKQESLAKFSTKIDFSKALKLAREQKIGKEVYAKYAEECLACGGCAFVCPTCTCFDVRDIVEKGKISRCRQWENCFFEGFTKEASGHNPRKIPADRIARRFEHKLAFEPKNNDMVACTGCGRCTIYCITKIGMQRFAELATTMQ